MAAGDSGQRVHVRNQNPAPVSERTAGTSTHVLENPTVRRPRMFTFLSLTIALADADNSTTPIRDRNSQNAIGGSREDEKPTVSDTAKLLLCSVRDSATAFSPLKSIAGGLCTILEMYEVRFTPYALLGPRCLQSPQRAQGNEEAIESLAPCVKSLTELLRAPVSEGTGEGLRRERLEQ